LRGVQEVTDSDPKMVYLAALYETKFKIITDRKFLIRLFNVTDSRSRLIRWRLKLENYKIIHKPGKVNANADALSRYVSTIICEKKKKENISARVYDEEEKRRRETTNTI